MPFGFEDIHREENFCCEKRTDSRKLLCECEGKREPSWATRSFDVKKWKAAFPQGSETLALLVGLSNHFDFPPFQDVELELSRPKVPVLFLKSRFLLSNVRLASPFFFETFSFRTHNLYLTFSFLFPPRRSQPSFLNVCVRSSPSPSPPLSVEMKKSSLWSWVHVSICTVSFVGSKAVSLSFPYMSIAGFLFTNRTFLDRPFPPLYPIA